MRAAIAAAGCLLVVLVAAWWIRDAGPSQVPADSETPAAQPAPEAPTANAKPPAAEPEPAAEDTPDPVREFRIVLSGGLPTQDSPTVLRVTRGDTVRLLVTSDAADELHLHGYDLHLDLEAGTTAELTFTAEHAGRFEYELHKRHQTVGALEVYPASR